MKEAAPAAGGWAAKKVSATEAPAAGAVEAQTRAAAERYFEAFGKRDGAALEAAYAPDAKFKDDMFDLSKRSSILNMWKKAPPFASFKAEILDVKGTEVHAKWTVEYEMFGNKVHNEIDSRLTFDAQGRITNQREDWDESRWMKQALPMIPKFLQPVAYFVMKPLLSWQMGG